MIRVFFGNPGCGKTTSACKFLFKNSRKYDYLYSNFETSCDISHYVSLDGLGEWTFPKYSYIAIDEAGIEYNNRKYKTLPQSSIFWYKMHRHFNCDCDVFSQSWNDMDITLRRLANEYWYMRKIGPFTLLRRIYKTVIINEQTHQIDDGYRFVKGIWLLLQPLRLLGLSRFFPQLKGYHLCFRPFYYRYFDSWSTPDGIPVKYAYECSKRPRGLLERIRILFFRTFFLRRDADDKEEAAATAAPFHLIGK